jgi:hypothetical protein
VGGEPGKLDGNGNKDIEAKLLAMQLMEKCSWDMAVDINVDLSGKLPPSSRAGRLRSGAWGSFVGLLKEEGQWQREEQSQISGKDLQRKDPEEDQGWAVCFH